MGEKENEVNVLKKIIYFLEEKGKEEKLWKMSTKESQTFEYFDIYFFRKIHHIYWFVLGCTGSVWDGTGWYLV